MQITIELAPYFPARSKGLRLQQIQPILVKQELKKPQKIAEFIWEIRVLLLTAAHLIFFAGCCFRAVQTNLSAVLPCPWLCGPTLSEVFILVFV